MGTRSVVAIPDPELGWKGRYVHWDGYPTGVGETLRKLVNRETREVAIEHLVNRNFGWSSLDERQGPEELEGSYADGRFRIVRGFGMAYTTEQGQSSPEDWIHPAGDTWGTEWAYVLEQAGIRVLKESCRDGQFVWHDYGLVRYDDVDGMVEMEKRAS